MTSDDRRHFERFPFSGRLEVRVSRGVPRADIAGSTLHAVAVDVSVGGFGFRSAAPLAVGDIIAVTLPELAVGDEGAAAHADDPDLQIFAVVRHVQRDSTTWVVGAERHA